MRFGIIVSLLLLWPVGAVAQGNSYLGVSLFQWTYDEDFAEEASAATIRLTVGTEVNPNLAMEAQFATGGSDTVFVSVPGGGSGNVEVELDNSFSFMLRPQTPGEDFRAFGLIGFSQGQITGRSGGVSVSEDDSGVSYGIGAEATIGENAWITIDYINYLRDDAYTFDALSLGMRTSF